MPRKYANRAHIYTSWATDGATALAPATTTTKDKMEGPDKPLPAKPCHRCRGGRWCWTGRGWQCARCFPAREGEAVYGEDGERLGAPRYATCVPCNACVRTRDAVAVCPRCGTEIDEAERAVRKDGKVYKHPRARGKGEEAR